MVHIYVTVRGLNKHPPLATSTSVNNCFLARAKSEAFDNIYSLLKKNKNSYNVSGEGNAGERCKTTVCLISKKATLHVQHTFFVHFFAVVLHDYNVKLPETS